MTASARTAYGTPSRSASALASAAASISKASQALSTSFNRLAVPAGPSQSVRWPRAANTASTASCDRFGPEARMRSRPVRAGSRLPDTGASTNTTSGLRRATSAARRSVASTPMVPICAQVALGRNASSVPSRNMTSATAPALGSMVTTTSAAATASVGLARTVAPWSASATVGPGERFQTWTGKPRSSMRRAMPAPMVPAPSSATGKRGG